MPRPHAGRSLPHPREGLRRPLVFRPEHLLREARRQNGLADAEVPAVCVLDPDGNLVRHLRAAGKTRPGRSLGTDALRWPATLPA